MANTFNTHHIAFPEKALLATTTIGIVKTAWNTDIIEPLFDDCVTQLTQRGIMQENIFVRTAPGAFELATGAQQLIKSASPDVCIALGALIKGETYHFEVLSHATAAGLQTLSLSGTTPVIFGVLTCNREQALERVQDGIAKGWADSALMMVHNQTTSLSKPQQMRQENL